MIEIYDDETLAAAFARQLDPLTNALAHRIASDARTSGLWDLTCIVIVEGEDDPATFQEVLGFTPSEGPQGGEVAAKVAYWAWLEDHGDVIELLITAGDSGFAWFVLVPRSWFEAEIGYRPM